MRDLGLLDFIKFSHIIWHLIHLKYEFVCILQLLNIFLKKLRLNSKYLKLFIEIQCNRKMHLKLLIQVQYTIENAHIVSLWFIGFSQTEYTYITSIQIKKVNTLSTPKSPSNNSFHLYRYLSQLCQQIDGLYSSNSVICFLY